jgi:DUF4097 and DUF4098 domain-containing protein YvlB
MSSSHGANATWRGQKVAAILGLGFLMAASNPSAQQRDRYTLSGEQVAIHNLAGELRVEPGTGPAVIVEVVRGGRDAGALSVQTGEVGGLQTLSIAYPARRVVYPRLPGHWSSTQSVDERGRFKDHFELIGQRQITVSGSGSGLEAWADLRILVPRGKKVVLHHAAGRARVQDIEGDLVVDHGIGTLDVHGVQGSISLDTGSGDVTVSNVQGDLSIDTGSGPVTINDVRGGELALDTGSGSVRATHVEVDLLNADTGSGDVELHEISAQRIRLDTGSGSVDLDLVDDARDISADTGSGSFTMRVPTNFGAEFDVEASSGAIDVGVSHEAFEIERDRVRGKIGDGHGRIKIDSGSGDVRILPAGARAQGRVGMLGTLVVSDLG